MRTFIDKLLDTWGEMSLWNQFGISFVATVGLVLLLMFLL